jgi:hypothetical protein
MEMKVSDLKSRAQIDPHSGLNRHADAIPDSRQSIRQKVSLTSRFVLSSDPGKADWFGTVLNLSSVGMLVRTDQIRNILTKERIFATIIFDDIYKTKLDMRCRVCRVLPDGTLLSLGIEFPFLTSLQREVLDRYLGTIKALSDGGLSNGAHF